MVTNVKYSIADVLNNIAVTMSGARGILEIPGGRRAEYFVKYDCLTPETNTK